MQSFIHNWGYVALFLYSFGGGMIALIIASILSYGGDLNIYITLIVAGSANFIGDQFLFLIARSNKNQAKQIMKKYQKKIALSYLMMKKYGIIVIFLQKYIYGIKTLIPLVMGLTKYNVKKFLFFNILATIVWTLIVGISSYILGDVVYTYATQFKTYGIIFLVIVLLIIIYWWRRI
jgi:membrane protein DedA with SNARE-associated domain